MKARNQFFKLPALVILSISFLFNFCGNDDSDPGPGLTGDSQEYALMSVGNSGINGTATFEELDNNSTRITLSLTGATAGGDHPAHIHLNTAAEGGAIVIDLTNVDGSNGKSITEVSTLNDGTPISYTELIDFDGYINVHKSSTDLGTLLAQGDIGQNELTGISEDYDLSSVSDPNISGEANFFERVNRETLVIINLEGDATDSDHPAHIHMNTAAEGGGIVIDLTNVKNGSSKTNVTALNSGPPITYDELKDFNGYINVHSSNLGTLIAQGDIGQNALTGTLKTYPLNTVSDPGISGNVTFSERVNGETLVVISLTGTSAGGDHPAHVHMNDAATGGGIVINLKNVNGNNGVSKTNVSKFNDDTPVNYDDLIIYNGYINVHNSPADLGTLIAQGNIGSNG